MDNQTLDDTSFLSQGDFLSCLAEQRVPGSEAGAASAGVPALGHRWVQVETKPFCTGSATSVPSAGQDPAGQGIQVRHDQHSGYMHHKFAVVDRRVLITGSLNWTTQAIQSNRENVLVVDDAACVKPFLDEFERIWEEYNPANYSFPKVGH